MKTNEKLPIHITPHHLTLSSSLGDFVRAKIEPLTRIGNDALNADVMLRCHHGTAHGKLFTASARLALPGRDIHSSAIDADLYSAINTLASRLARRLRKRKTRFEKRIEPDWPEGGITSAAHLEESLLAA